MHTFYQSEDRLNLISGALMDLGDANDFCRNAQCELDEGNEDFDYVGRLLISSIESLVSAVFALENIPTPSEPNAKVFGVRAYLKRGESPVPMLELLKGTLVKTHESLRKIANTVSEWVKWTRFHYSSQFSLAELYFR